MFSRFLHYCRALFRTDPESTNAPAPAVVQPSSKPTDGLAHFLRDSDVTDYLSRCSPKEDRWALFHTQKESFPHRNMDFHYLVWYARERMVQYHEFKDGSGRCWSAEELRVRNIERSVPGISRGCSINAHYSFADMAHVLIGDFLEMFILNHGECEQSERLVRKYVGSYEEHGWTVLRIASTI
jgi:hypothetical protein